MSDDRAAQPERSRSIREPLSRERRRFLRILTRISWLLPLLLGWAGLHRSRNLTQPKTLLVVPLPIDRKIVYLDEAQLMRRGDGFHAVSTRCTHLGCRVRAEGDELVCPCHGSRFAASGEVLSGPARDPLPTLKITENPDRSQLEIELPI